MNADKNRIRVQKCCCYCERNYVTRIENCGCLSVFGNRRLNPAAMISASQSDATNVAEGFSPRASIRPKPAIHPKIATKLTLTYFSSTMQFNVMLGLTMDRR